MPIERIAVGNGSCDILLAAGEALLEPGAELVYAWPSFSVYPQLEAASGARAIRVAARRRSDRHDLDAMAAEVTVATRLVIVCNPNNPTSTALSSSSRIAEFLARIPSHVCVLIDEAYCEFNLLDDPDASIALLDRHPNLVLLRTFSKVYGLCGLRVGYALCGSRELPDALDAGSPAVLLQRRGAGRGGRGARATRTRSRAASSGSSSPACRCEEGLRELGIEPADVAGQLLLVRRSARSATRTRSSRGLAEQGVLVRAGTALGQRRARCASPTARRRRTRASSRRSRRCCSCGAATSQPSARAAGGLAARPPRAAAQSRLCSDAQRARSAAYSARIRSA